MKNQCGLMRGTVIDNVDPLNAFRLRLLIPQLSADPLRTWILGCTPGETSLPAIGSQVWVMFEGGDTDFPVWLGAVPALEAATLATDAQTSSSAGLPSAVPDDGTKVTPIFQVVPPSRAPFQFAEWSNGPQTDGTYDHWTGFGFNSAVQPVTNGASGAPVTAGQAAMYTGIEDSRLSTDRSTTDAATTVGSPTVTSASGAFTTFDVGKPVEIAGFTGITYIGAVNSSTSIGLSASPTTNLPVDATVTASGVGLTVQTEAAEWYVAHWSPDHTSVPMFRPFYTRVSQDNNVQHHAFTYCDIGSDGLGAFTVTSNGILGALFKVTSTQVTTTAGLQVGGALQTDGVVTLGTTSGTPTLAAGAALGTSPPVPTIAGNAVRGVVSFGTGTTPAAGTALTVTLPTALSTSPIVVVGWDSLNGANNSVVPCVVSTAPGSFVIGLGAALPASQPAASFALSYIVIG